jgi:GntR family transcriptional regulator
MREKLEPSEIERARLRLGAVDRNDSTYLHDQVAAEIRRAIADGEAAPGDRIPQARDLAAVLGVNTNTALRALRLLRDEGLLEMGRGRAIRVAGTPARTAVVDKVRELLELGRSHGYRRDEIVALVQTLPARPGT